MALLLQNAKIFRHGVRDVDLVFDTVEHFKFLCVFLVMLLGSLDVLPNWTQLVLDDLEHFQKNCVIVVMLWGLFITSC